MVGDELVPADWLARLARLPADVGPSGADWSRAAPRLVRDVMAEWGLSPDGSSRTGWTAVVVPVRRDDEPLALKVVWPHAEAVAEHLALRHWDGEGAVRLVAADPGRWVLLLERLDPIRDLTEMWDEEACAIAGGLLRRLHIPPPPNVPGLREFVSRHMSRMAGRPDLPRRVVTQVTGLARDLLSEPDAESALVHTDLHYENVLAGEREPWLVIDPKPLAGHPGFEIQPLLRNRIDELGSGSAFRWGVRRRLEVTCDAMGLDPEVGRAWTVVHTGIKMLWAADEGNAEDLSAHIAILKALDS